MIALAVAAAGVALDAFLAWATKNLPQDETVTVVAAVRRFVREGVGPTVQGFQDADAEIDAELARLEAEGK